MSAVLPRHRVNVLTGIKSAKLIEDPAEYAELHQEGQETPACGMGLYCWPLGLNGKLADGVCSGHSQSGQYSNMCDGPDQR
jgi:hypothetical protein